MDSWDISTLDVNNDSYAEEFSFDAPHDGPYRVICEGPEGVLVGREGEQVMFQQVAEYRPVRWPDPAHPQPPSRVLTSMMKRVDNAVFAACQDVKNNAFQGGTRILGLKEGGVAGWWGRSSP